MSVRRIVTGVLLGAALGCLVFYFLLAPGGQGRRGSAISKPIPLPERPLAPTLKGRPAPMLPAEDVPRVPHEIVVQVLDEETGECIRGADVYCWDGDTLFSAREGRGLGATDAEGRRVLPRTVLESAPQNALLMVRAWGYLPSSQALSSLLAAGVDGPQAVYLQRGLAVRGKVVDIWGDAVAGAEVQTFGRYGRSVRSVLGETAPLLPGPRAVQDFQRTTTGPEGRFEISGVPALPVQIRAHKRGYIHLGPRPVVTDPDEELLVTLAGIERVGLRVQDAATGRRLRTYRSRIRGDRGLSAGPCEYLIAGKDDGVPWTGWNPRTGETWRAFWVQKPETRDGREVTVSVEAEGFLPYSARVPLLRSGAPLDAHVINLQRDPHARLGTVRLHVRFPILPRPLSHCSVNVWAHERKERRRRFEMPLDEEGWGSLPLIEGEYRLGLIMPGGLSWWHGEPMHEGEVRVVADQVTTKEHTFGGCLVDVRAQTREGDFLPAFDLALARNGRGLGVVQVDRLMRGDLYWRRREIFEPMVGLVRLALAPGTYWFSINRPGTDSPIVEVELRAGEKQNLVLVTGSQ